MEPHPLRRGALRRCCTLCGHVDRTACPTSMCYSKTVAREAQQVHETIGTFSVHAGKENIQPAADAHTRPVPLPTQKQGVAQAARVPTRQPTNTELDRGLPSQDQRRQNTLPPVNRAPHASRLYLFSTPEVAPQGSRPTLSWTEDCQAKQQPARSRAAWFAPRSVTRGTSHTVPRGQGTQRRPAQREMQQGTGDVSVPQVASEPRREADTERVQGTPHGELAMARLYIKPPRRSATTHR